MVAQDAAARVRVYDYGTIRTALTDPTTGGCDAFMKLAPVLTELVKPVAGVEVVQRRISHEYIAIAVPWPRKDSSVASRLFRKAWSGTEGCSGYDGNGWAIHIPTRAWPCTEPVRA